MVYMKLIEINYPDHVYWNIYIKVDKFVFMKII